MKRPETIFKKWYQVLEDATVEQTMFFESMIEQYERKGCLTEKQINKLESVLEDIQSIDVRDLREFDLLDLIGD